MAVTGDPYPGRPAQPLRARPGPRASIPGRRQGRRVSRFAADDVVRHPLVERIVRAYDAQAKHKDGKMKRAPPASAKNMIEI